MKYKNQWSQESIKCSFKLMQNSTPLIKSIKEIFANNVCCDFAMSKSVLSSFYQHYCVQIMFIKLSSIYYVG